MSLNFAPKLAPLALAGALASQAAAAAPTSLTVYTTARDTDARLARSEGPQFSSADTGTERDVFVFVDPAHSFQQFIGIGGAITDASAEVFAKLPKDKQAELLRAYYDPKDGIGYTWARTNMASCDFSSDLYDYVAAGDMSLKSFNISHDLKYKIPLIKAAMKETDGKLLLFASPWSPPAWMKTNGDRLHGGSLKKDCYAVWADYFVKFIQAYKAQGVPLFAVTVQNEPMAVQKWDSCIFTPEEERDFVAKDLGPTFKETGLDTRIIVWDHNRDLAYPRAAAILGDKEAAQYVWGFGFHWYEDWAGGEMQFNNIRKVKESFPDTHLVFTEGCNGPFAFDKIKDWNLGERYAHSMVHDFNAGTEAWTDWNILLDEQGGPNHVGNYCFAPIHADTRTGELIYGMPYYYIGQFSKFIQRGAHRIADATNRQDLETTAFANPDGSLVVVVLNRSDKSYDFSLKVGGQSAPCTSAPRSINTYVIK